MTFFDISFTCCIFYSSFLCSVFTSVSKGQFSSPDHPLFPRTTFFPTLPPSPRHTSQSQPCCQGSGFHICNRSSLYGSDISSVLTLPFSLVSSLYFFWSSLCLSKAQGGSQRNGSARRWCYHSWFNITMSFVFKLGSNFGLSCLSTQSLEKVRGNSNLGSSHCLNYLELAFFFFSPLIPIMDSLLLIIYFKIFFLVCVCVVF